MLVGSVYRGPELGGGLVWCELDLVSCRLCHLTLEATGAWKVKSLWNRQFLGHYVRQRGISLMKASFGEGSPSPNRIVGGREGTMCAILGSCRWVMKRPLESTTIHWRSQAKPDQAQVGHVSKDASVGIAK